MFNFGTTVKRVKEENPFDSQMVVIMNAVKGEGSNRRFTFSKLAGETLEFHKNTQESDVPPIYTNTTVSTAVKSDNGIDPSGYSIFVNNGSVPAPQLNIGKTTNGFSNKDLYEKLAELYSLDTSIDNVLTLERATGAESTEEEYGIEIYNIMMTPADNLEGELMEDEDTFLGAPVDQIPSDLLPEEVTGRLEDVVMNDNSEVSIELED